MPELPEVETIKRDLEKKIIGTRIINFIDLWPKTLKGIKAPDFKKKVIGQKLVKVTRRAKLIIIKLENNLNLVFHMKMTGHLLIEPDTRKIDSDGNWVRKEGALKDPYNQYIRAVFWLDNNKIIAFSDLRKFGYIKLLTSIQLNLVTSEFGPEPFSVDFKASYLQKKFSKKRIAIKKALLDQKIIAGIGNIYADEILYRAAIHPETQANKISVKEIDKIIILTRKILGDSIEARGTSTSDYRDTDGQQGKYMNKLKVYGKKGSLCDKCQTEIEKIKVGARGTYFCPKCQVKR